MSAVMTVRGLTDAERRAYHTANLVAFDRMPYFADALFSVIPVAAPGLKTFAVDRFWRLYLDPELLVGDQGWSVQEIGTVVLHEMGHLLRVHAERAEALPQPLSVLVCKPLGQVFPRHVDCGWLRHECARRVGSW